MSGKLIALLILSLFIISISAACSDKKQEPSTASFVESIHKRLLQEEKRKADMANNSSLENEKLRAKYLAVADACDNKFISCTDKCTNTKCEDLCLKALAGCEKDLPVEFRTLK
jgi:hypothetical protein